MNAKTPADVRRVLRSSPEDRGGAPGNQRSTDQEQDQAEAADPAPPLLHVGLQTQTEVALLGVGRDRAVRAKSEDPTADEEWQPQKRHYGAE